MGEIRYEDPELTGRRAHTSEAKMVQLSFPFSPTRASSRVDSIGFPPVRPSIKEGRRDRQCYQKGDIKTLAALPWAGGVRKEKQVMQNGEG